MYFIEISWGKGQLTEVIFLGGGGGAGHLSHAGMRAKTSFKIGTPIVGALKFQAGIVSQGVGPPLLVSPPFIKKCHRHHFWGKMIHRDNSVKNDN